MKEIIAPVNKLQKFFAVRETLFKNMSSTQVTVYLVNLMKMLKKLSVWFNCSYLPSCFSGLVSSIHAELWKSLADGNGEQGHDSVSHENSAVLIIHHLLQWFLF